MRRVWAPWRISYVLSKKKPRGCIFCLRRSAGYRKRYFVLAESARSFVVLNHYPYTAGHIMAVPRRHVPDLDSMTIDELNDLFRLVRSACRALRKAIRPEGFNIGANIGKPAGAGVDAHVHVHIVPRWVGDHNFLPVVSDTLPLPELLQDTYKRLLPFFEQALATDDDPL